MNFLFPIYVLLEIMQWLILADVILSWLQLFGLKIRPKFLADIIDPLYDFVRKYLPTSIGPIDFTPIVILMVIFFVTGLLNMTFPGSYEAFRAYF